MMTAAQAAAGCGLVLDPDPPDPSADAAAAADAGPIGCTDDCDAGLDAATNDPDTGIEIDAGREELDAATTADDAGPPDSGRAPPTCTILGPPDGTEQPYDDDWTFIARADDPEDGALGGASVVWRSDRVVAPLGSGLSTSAALEPGEHTITCTATDSDGNSGVASITVVSRSPVTTILHPGEGEVRSAASDVPFSGTARDFEDGTLGGESLVWTSSRDGMLGTGASFFRRLSPGAHVITLTATDVDGNVGTDAISLTITP